MDFSWLIVAGVLLLVAGLSAVALDTVRRRRSRVPFQYPDVTTALLNEEEMSTALSALPPPPPVLSTLPTGAQAIPLGRTSSRRPRQYSRATWKSWAAAGALGGALLGAGLSAFLVAARPASLPAGSFGIVVADLGRSPAGKAIASEVASSIVTATARLQHVAVRPSRVIVLTEEDAEAERARTGASIFIWGDVGESVGVTISLSLAPALSIGSAEWQRWTDADPGLVPLAASGSLHFPPGASLEPVSPVVLAAAELSSGDDRSALQSATQAWDQLRSEGATGDLAYSLIAASNAASGAFDAAASAYDSLDARGALSANDRVGRAYVLFKLGRLDEARNEADYVIENRAAEDTVLARAYLLRERITLRQSGDDALVASDVDAASRLDPSYVPARIDGAEQFYREAMPDRARSELEGVLKVDTNAAPAYRLLGLVWLMLGKPKEAQSSIARAQAIYGGWIAALRADEARAQVTGDASAASAATDGIVLLNRELAAADLYQGMALGDQAKAEPPETFLGTIWRRLRGQPSTYERALAAMKEAQRLDPKRADVALQMGGVYAALGDASSAAASYQLSESLGPDSPEPYLALANLQAQQGQVRDAAATIDGYLSHMPGSYRAFQALYELYVKTGNKEQSSATLRRALSVPAATASDHMWHGRFLVALGQKDQAIAELQAATADPGQWQAHLLLGQLYEEEGHAPEALAQFEAVVDKQPNQPEALLEAGRLLASQGESAQAEILLQRLTQVSGGNVDGHVAYAQLLAAEGQLGPAADEARRAVEADGSSADAHFELALIYEAQQNWPKAAAEFQATTVRDPSRFEAFIRWAAAMERDDLYTETISVCDRAIKMRADDPQAYRWKAEAQVALRDPAGALETVSAGLKADPGNANLLAIAARAYSLEGDAATAQRYARKSIDAAPGEVTGRIALGDVLLAAGDKDGALAAFRDASAQEPTSPEALCGQGQALAAKGDVAAALRLYGSASEEDPRFGPSHVEAGRIYFAESRWSEALSEYRAAVAVRPNWPEALYYLGSGFLQGKDLQNARDAFSKATSGSPNLFEAWFGLGLADRELGRRQEAIAALSKAASLNPSYADAWLYLGLSYEESGDRTGAQKAFGKAALSTDPEARARAEEGLARVK